MTDSFRLRDLISEKGIKLKHIAIKLGISSYYLSMKIDNKTDFKTTEVLILCDILGIKSLKEKDEIFFAKKVDK